MRKSAPLFCALLLSLSARRAWIEIHNAATLSALACSSLSARRAWIEIETSSIDDLEPSVALRKESVDRNTYFLGRLLQCCVALRKESVDRNGTLLPMYRLKSVALRKESVDRNSTYVTRLPRVQVSLSARRAWIEMLLCCMIHPRLCSRSPQGERG